MARKESISNYDDLKKSAIAVTKLPDAVVDKQLKEHNELPLTADERKGAAN